jgi:hypothetical protein
MRLALPFGLLLSAVMGFAALPAKADPLADAFPAPLWQRENSPAGAAFDCMNDACGQPAHVMMMRGPASPAMAARIRSGSLTREWAEKLAVSFHKQQGDKVTVLSFDVKKGQAPHWTMVYECQCEGRKNFVASRTVAADKVTMTFYSLGRTPEMAQENMNKIIEAALGANTR